MTNFGVILLCNLIGLLFPIIKIFITFSLTMSHLRHTQFQSFRSVTLGCPSAPQTHSLLIRSNKFQYKLHFYQHVMPNIYPIHLKYIKVKRKNKIKNIQI
jgi:hypothetical protein